MTVSFQSRQRDLLVDCEKRLTVSVESQEVDEPYKRMVSPPDTGAGRSPTVTLLVTLLAWVSFSASAIPSCSLFQTIAPLEPQSFGVWHHEINSDGMCQRYYVVDWDGIGGEVDGWLVFARAVCVVSCLLGLSIVGFLAIAPTTSMSNDSFRKIAWRLLALEVLLSASLLSATRSSLCQYWPHGKKEYYCKVDVSWGKGGCLFVASIFLYSFAMIALCLEVGPSRKMTTARQNEVPDTHVSDENYKERSLPGTATSNSELMVDFITEADGTKTQRSTLRFVQEDQSLVMKETTEVLERPLLDTSDVHCMKEAGVVITWSTMVVESITSPDKTIVKTTSRFHDHPDGSRSMERTVDTIETRLVTLEELPEEASLHLQGNGRFVAIDNIRQRDGSHTKTTITTSRVDDTFFMVERISLVTLPPNTTSHGHDEEQTVDQDASIT